MSESSEMPPIRPSTETTTVKLRKMIPGLEERAARRRDFAEIFEKAFERVTTDDPEQLTPSEHDHTRSPSRRVDYNIRPDDISENVTIFMFEPREDGEMTLYVISHVGSTEEMYQVNKKGDRIQVGLLSQGDDRIRQKSEGILTEKNKLTQKGRKKLIDLLDTLPYAQRSFFHTDQTAVNDELVTTATANLDEEIKTLLDPDEPE